ncbi:MAG: hypothetical protein ACD_19C00426G0085 [uncultured bacterium]|nr:MAG: hypothetical protein ACD_19C00426G0085 [uncultured bacterium]
MTIIFDGKDYAQKKKILIQSSANKVRELGIIPHLATILIGNDPASILYSNLKKKFIESLGCQVDIYELPETVKYEEIELLIKTLNDDETVHGIMIQMPLPSNILNLKTSILNLISKSKDVDGLQSDSVYLHPTSKAVMEVLAMAIYETRIDVVTVCVVGANGMVGKPLVKELKKLGYIVLEADENTEQTTLQGLTLQSDAIVSTTGKMNLITPEMVKNNSIVIDVGSPHGDISQDVANKASFFTPVPGGVGPVTITCLAENLILAANKVRP